MVGPAAWTPAEYDKKVASPTDKLHWSCISSILQSKHVKLILTDHYNFFAMSAEAMCGGWSDSMDTGGVL